MAGWTRRGALSGAGSCRPSCSAAAIRRPRTPREIWSVRLLSAREAAALNPLACLASLGLVLAPLTNLRWLPLAPAAAAAASAAGPSSRFAGR